MRSGAFLCLRAATCARLLPLSTRMFHVKHARAVHSRVPVRHSPRRLSESSPHTPRPIARPRVAGARVRPPHVAPVSHSRVAGVRVRPPTRRSSAHAAVVRSAALVRPLHAAPACRAHRFLRARTPPRPRLPVALRSPIPAARMFHVKHRTANLSCGRIRSQGASRLAGCVCWFSSRAVPVRSSLRTDCFT